MSILGFNDLKAWALPLGWDATELQKAQFALAGGTSLDEVYNTAIAGAMGVANEMLAHPIYGGLIYVTTEAGKEYRNGGTNDMEERAEYTKPDPKKASVVGNMYPLKSYDRGLGFTMDYLRKARPSQIEANLADAFDAVRNRFQINVLSRFFSSAENQLGSSGYDTPFVKNGGTVTYTPPSWGGNTHTSSHTHFERRGTSDHAAALEVGAKHLWHHGITGPYIGIIPDADRATYTALPKFRAPKRTEVEYATNVSLAMVNEEVFIGVYETDYGVIYLHANPRLPTAYLGVTKTYGSNNRLNPLAVRVSPDYQFSPVLLRGGSFQLSPLENMQLIHEYGVGVNDRLAGWCCYFASSGSYTDPTIS